jgi:elongation factor 1-beta
MGTVIVKIKIMPKNPKVNLEEVESKVKEIIKKHTTSDMRFVLEPIAFGLSALNILFVIDESKSTEEIERQLSKIKGVNSAEVVDLRRSLG